MSDYRVKTFQISDDVVARIRMSSFWLHPNPTSSDFCLELKNTKKLFSRWHRISMGESYDNCLAVIEMIKQRQFAIDGVAEK